MRTNEKKKIPELKVEIKIGKIGHIWVIVIENFMKKECRFIRALTAIQLIFYATRN